MEMRNVQTKSDYTLYSIVNLIGYFRPFSHSMIPYIYSPLFKVAYQNTNQFKYQRKLN